jgi:hypothetical protein
MRKGFTGIGEDLAKRGGLARIKLGDSGGFGGVGGLRENLVEGESRDDDGDRRGPESLRLIGCSSFQNTIPRSVIVSTKNALKQLCQL